MDIESLIQETVVQALQSLYGVDVNKNDIQVQQTRKDFEGDKTVVVFPFLKHSKKKPEDTAAEIGEYLVKSSEMISSFNVIKGFLNLSLDQSIWRNVIADALSVENYGFSEVTENSPIVMVEYSSPNTNKPLHLGHIRNNLLGYSISKLLEADGKKVVKVNLVNDRGIHICKSMIAWIKYGNEQTPESTGIKGDHFVGDYYVKFDQEYKKQIAALVEKGVDSEKAKMDAPILLEAREMLKKWEDGDEETVALWRKMNNWVYKGFDETYRQMGVEFDKIYYESETYLLGKSKVIEGLDKGVLFKKEDGSVWADLSENGLDQKLLLRPDGTSVYMTQDIGTAIERFLEYGDIKELIYVVGNEQNYHFDVLKIILKKLGYAWSDAIYHMSYGMVELPEGKMKSREGTVVDADDLMEEMISQATAISKELGKLGNIDEAEADKIYEQVAMGALKYFILKVEPKKTMTFNPKESIDFNGNTGPFIQYTYARINSILNKATDMGIDITFNMNVENKIHQKEVTILHHLVRYKDVIAEAANAHSPSMIANYIYDLVKEYNQYYHDFPILKCEDENDKIQRLQISKIVGMVIKSGMGILGIEMPDRM